VRERLATKPIGPEPHCELTVGFSIWHLGRNLLARHLALGVSHGLLVEALGLFLLLETRRPDFLAVGGGSVLGLEERLEEIYGDGQDDGGVLVDRDLLLGTWALSLS